MRRAWLPAVALAAVSVGWLDPFAKAREAARLYTAGKYDDAVAQYNEALTDQPDSALLHFNLGDAAYKQGRYTDAVNALEQGAAGDTARAAYNIGNAKYRLGEAAESKDPKSALGLYAEALVAYRRAMGAAPDDVDAKFNHEFVEKKIADLKKKLEEQQKQQEQRPQDQQIRRSNKRTSNRRTSNNSSNRPNRSPRRRSRRNSSSRRTSSSRPPGRRSGSRAR